TGGSQTGIDDFAAAVAKVRRALDRFRVDGVTTNLPLLRKLLRHPALATYRVTTRFVDDHARELVAADGDAEEKRAGARIDARDPLAVLVHGKSSSAPRRVPAGTGPAAASESAVVVRAPMQGTIVGVDVAADDEVSA